ncbi:C10 family peptidase [bacterium]|nr:C10 family peptidase [bacterium]
MRRVIITSLLFVLVPAFAATIVMDDAECVARTYINANANGEDIKATKFLTKDTITLAYVFELSPRGFIVVSANSDIEPLISYSNETNFDFDTSSNNVLFHMIILDMNMRFEAIKITSSEVIEKNNAMWRAFLSSDMELRRHLSTMEIYGPLLDTHWEQTSPFNTYCPIDPSSGGRSVVGCTATSMAQILNYWEYPPFVRFTEDDSYTSGWEPPYIAIDATTASIDSIEYNTYLGPHPSDHFKAALSFAAGVSVQSNYSSYGTGANVDGEDYNYQWGYKNSFQFSGDAAGFLNVLRDDMIAGRPAQLAIYKAGWEDGHAINCDGYNTTGLYHLNMGWGGSYDNWYSLPSGMPVGYSIINYGVLNIETDPRTDSPDACTEAMYISPEPAIQSIRDAVYPLGDRDWFMFSASRESTYAFYASGNSNTYAEIYSSCSSAPLVSSGGTAINEHFSIEFLPSEDGVYYLMTRGESDTTYGYYSLHYQTYPGPGIELTYPNGDEPIEDDNTCILRWEKSGIPSFNAVKIEYSFVGPDGPWISIVDSTTWGFYIWNVPDIDGHVYNCYVRISSLKYDFANDKNDTPIRIIDVSAIEETALPGEFSLSAYPNPFNFAVTISLDGVEVPLRVEIFDLAGRRVDVIARRATPDVAILPQTEGDCHALRARNDGYGEFIWQPDESIGSGIYLVRASSGNSEITKRIVYLK